MSQTLAIDGGRPVRTTAYPAWPFFAEDEIAAVEAVLRSGRVNYHTGTEGKTFETEFAGFVGSRHAIALANGTLALELGLREFGIGPGDDVIVPPRTFIATASAVVACGARPVFADVDRDDQNLSAASIAAAVTPATRGVIVVHLAGRPAEMDAIVALCDERELVLIEDCAQALGATYKGRHVGTFGHAAAFSFCQDKIITTGGEGGMLVLDDEARYRSAWSYKDHGKSYELVCETPAPPGVSFRWLHERFGTNWRLSEMQSVIGRLALAKVPAWVEQRRANSALLIERFAAHPALRVPAPASHVYDAYYRLYAFVRPELLALGWTRDRIAEAVKAEGVPCMTGSCSEIYLERAFTDAGLTPPQPLPVARELGETSLAFLVHHTANEDDMRDVADAVDKVMEVAGR